MVRVLPRQKLAGDHPPLETVFDLRSECQCGVPCGSYQAIVALPKRPPETKECFVDECIASEIARLRRLGVETIASCCGHGRIRGSLIVDESSIGLMGSLGYRDFRSEP